MCHTKSCGCLKHIIGKYNKTWTGFEDISGKYWKSIKHGAKMRNLEFSITIENAWNKFIKQNQKCALTGVVLNHTTWNSKNKTVKKIVGSIAS